MPRPLLRTTTALTVCLSLANPLPLVAQGVVTPQAEVADATSAEKLLLEQICAEDPSQPDCVAAQDQADQPVVPEGESLPPPVDGVEAVPPSETAVPEEPPAEQPAAEAQPEIAPADAVPEAAEVSEPEPTEQPRPPVEQAPAAETGADATAPTEEPAVGAAPAEVVPETEAAGAEPSAPETTQAEPTLGETAPEAVDGVDPQSADALPDIADTAEPVPEPTPEQQQVIETLMADPDVAAAVETLSETVAPEAGQEAGGAAIAAAAAAAGAAPPPVETTTQTLGIAETRSSAQDFATPLAVTVPTTAEDDEGGLSDLEKAGLLALGAVAVGMLINNNRVVAKSGDRVVVDRGDGNLAVWKDDNAILRTPGVVETTQRYNDGSTLTRLARTDGSEILTVRDATGRVIRRELLQADGTRVPLIDDTRSYAPVVVSELPRPRWSTLDLADERDPALWRALLDEAEQTNVGRTFSLAQVRDIRQVRELAPELSAGTITFETGSAAIRPEQANKLARLAALMRDLVEENPSEVFLVEGHTDAVGSAAYNLALSDRRAESIALALSGIFEVPAENMVVQGYGERYLKVQTQAAEPLNRRVALRRITWLMDGV